MKAFINHLDHTEFPMKSIYDEPFHPECRVGTIYDAEKGDDIKHQLTEGSHNCKHSSNFDGRHIVSSCLHLESCRCISGQCIIVAARKLDREHSCLSCVAALLSCRRQSQGPFPDLAGFIVMQKKPLQGITCQGAEPLKLAPS